MKNFFYPERHSYFPIEYLYGIQRPIDRVIVTAIFQLDAAKKSCRRVILTSVYPRWPFEAAPLKRVKRWL
ncbi:MAG: hypothetical protein A4S09_13720 [Proteobacteria bacterium SG_bin7]|nr:MAG: hypothetical protein A4S09_13720 [Proteobacteria bacterium SG_bin7]